MARSNDRDATTLPTAIGLALALVAPLLFSLLIGPAFLEPATTPDIYALIGFAVYWAIALSLVAITRFGERRSLASLGFKGLPWRMVAVAVGLGILLSATVPVLTLLVSQVLPSAESEGVMDTAAGYPPAVILLSVLTAGVTEEVLFRGYAIERLRQLTRRPWVSALVSLTFFVLAHAPGWNLNHVVGVVLPLGAVLTGLYMWQRNLVFVIIVHLLVDLPLFFLALGT